MDFDLSLLDRIAAAERVPLELGRGPGGLRLRSLIGVRGASVPGRVVLDGIQLLRGAFVRMEDYGLDAVARGRLTGLPLDRVASSIAAFDFLYLSALGPRRVVAPSVRGAGASDEPQGGGHVLEPRPGLYANVVVLDFRSLYPSLIRTFEIDPLSLVRPEEGQAADDPILAPSGAAFVGRKGILSEMWTSSDPAASRRASEATRSRATRSRS